MGDRGDWPCGHAAELPCPLVMPARRGDSRPRPVLSSGPPFLGEPRVPAFSPGGATEVPVPRKVPPSAALTEPDAPPPDESVRARGMNAEIDVFAGSERRKGAAPRTLRPDAACCGGGGWPLGRPATGSPIPLAGRALRASFASSALPDGCFFIESLRFSGCTEMERFICC